MPKPCIVKQMYDLYWSPEGRQIATVEAKGPRSAVKKAPKPYKKYRGEIYAVPTGATRWRIEAK